ncbi:uncharacterized protein [Dysidea avara]|uniref:uncharacterized protein isoform X3 n=1 Tax=Dysidea avara TaxID=196820 RepID=UPI00331F3FC8
MTTKSDEDLHKTTIIVTIEQTVAGPDKLPDFHETVRDNKKKRVYDAPKPSCYFHMEYQLLPGQASVYKTDVVAFGIVSKVYTDADSRVVKTSPEGANISYGWKHTHSFKVNKDLLLDLYNHVFCLRIWEGKNKVSPRARFDQPKAFRLPASKKTSDSEDDVFGGRQMNFPKVAHEQNRVRPNKSRVAEMQLSRVNEISNLSLMTSPSPHKNSPITDSDTQVNQSWSKMTVLSRPSPTPATPIKPTKGDSPLILKTQASRLAERAREEQERNGIVVLSLCMANLFANQKSLTVKMPGPKQNLLNCRLTLILKSPLMPEQLRRELNPMTITILSANNLPNTPNSYEELQEKCEPACVSYQFLGHDKVFRTSGQSQSPNPVWGESRVFLLGVLDKMLLTEYLRGPPLQLELHDRDRKLKENNEPLVFGKQEEDNLLGTTAFVEGHSVEVNPFVDVWKPWDSHGVAYCDLSSLLWGDTHISTTVAVLAGPRGPEKASDLLKPPTGEVCEMLPPGDYLQSGTEVSLEVDLTYPLTSYPKPEHVTSCPFGRIVFNLSYQHKELVQQLLTLVNNINIKALGLNDIPEDEALAILSTYKLTKEQIMDSSLDVVTGFHVLDGEVHIIVLEGLRDEGILHIWENTPRHSSQSMGVVEVLYNSDYAFSERLYGDLDVEICCVRLHQPLHRLVQMSQPYVWNKMPHQCFQGLMCINGLQQVSKLSDATRMDLFPTVQMIQQVSMEFAVPALIEELATKEQHGDTSERSHSSCELHSPALPDYTKSPGHHRWTPLDNYNKTYDNLLQHRTQQPCRRDHIHDNVLKTKALAEASSWKKRRSRSFSDDPRLRRMFTDLSVPKPLDDVDESQEPAHNYSIQTFNSNRLATKRMQQRLAQDPKARFTYCQRYHFRTITPISVEKIPDQYSGPDFVIYPHKTSLESNHPPQDPDFYKKEDLMQPFEDNTLHANKLRPTVDREQFSWERRHNDFELYRKPPADFGSSPPVTIHLAGAQRKREVEHYRQKEIEKWSSKIVVDRTIMDMHRLGISTELSAKPLCDADKLKGLLKDEPQKMSLKSPGLKLNEPPALFVLKTAEVRPDSNISNDMGLGYIPGPMDNRSLKLDKNVIPVADRNRSNFIKTKGQDFRLHYHTDQSMTSQPVKLPTPVKATTDSTT